MFGDECVCVWGGGVSVCVWGVSVCVWGGWVYVCVCVWGGVCVCVCVCVCVVANDNLNAIRAVIYLSLWPHTAAVSGHEEDLQH